MGTLQSEPEIRRLGKLLQLSLMLPLLLLLAAGFTVPSRLWLLPLGTEHAVVVVVADPKDEGGASVSRLVVLEGLGRKSSLWLRIDPLIACCCAAV